MNRHQTQRLLYHPCDPHQAGTGIWLISRYKKEDPERRIPKWQQWLRLRDRWMAEQEEKFGENNLTCVICGRTGLHAFDTNNRPKKDLATIDHILPVSKYPNLWNVTSNFQIACVRCNQKKGNKC